MNGEFRKQIYSRMNEKDTNELLEIWQSNYRYEWSDEAFDVVNGILKERGVEVPEQDNPVYEQVEETEDREEYDFNGEELKIINDENPPAFYDPFEVLLLTKRFDWMIKAMIVFGVIYGLLSYPNSRGVVQGFFYGNPNSALVFGLAVLLAIANTALLIFEIFMSQILAKTREKMA